MSVSQIFSFTNPSDFVFNNTEILNGKAKLSLIDNPSQLFEQTFDNDSGFIYDSEKIEFVAGEIRQIDQRPSDSIFGANYTNNLDPNWTHNGFSVTAVPTSNPIVLNGKMVLDGSNYITYNLDQNLPRTHTIKFKFTPQYNGSPSTQKRFLSVFSSSEPTSYRIFHFNNDGTIRLEVRDTSNNQVIGLGNLGGFNAIAGQEYIFEINVDLDSANFKFFIDGVENGNIAPSNLSSVGDFNRVRLGADRSGNNETEGEYDDLIVFNDVQNTANHSASYSVSSFLYASTVVQIPPFTYTGIGTIQAVESSNIVETDEPRYIVAGLYWDGSAWVPSNGTYAQANDSATTIAQLSNLSVEGASFVPVAIVFQESNTLGSVDIVSVTVTGQKYSPTGYVEPAQALQVKSIIGYINNITTTANTDLKVIFKIDNVLTYFDGEDWIESDGSINEANTAQEINDNISSLNLGNNSSVFIRWVLVSNENTETPEISSAEIEFNFGAIESGISLCRVYGYLKNISDEPVINAKMRFKLESMAENPYKEAQSKIISSSEVSVITDSNGYFLIPLIPSTFYEDDSLYRIIIEINNSTVIGYSSASKIVFQVPEADFKDITDLLPNV